MPIASFIDHAFMRGMDFIFNRLRQPVPCHEALKRCKLISHRGEHDFLTVKENTLAAFERAASSGVWGIELDVRWTKDLVPVVAHDPDLRRVWGHPALIADLDRQQLRRIAPEIPSLSDVASRFGPRLHLMIEIKKNPWPDPQRQNHGLHEHLGSLQAVENYHFMALHPTTLTRLQGFGPQCLVAIANHLPGPYSRWIEGNQWGGLCTHYSMMRRSLIAKHHARGQHIGTAYPTAANCLFREINRGVDWIFSNHAVALQQIIDRFR
jgi:glycerophosphoryl diester phosphodiesterase